MVLLPGVGTGGHIRFCYLGVVPDGCSFGRINGCAVVFAVVIAVVAAVVVALAGALEGSGDVAGHGELDCAFGVVPFEVQGTVLFAFPIGGDCVAFF